MEATLEPSEEDVVVAHGAEQRAEPLQLVAEDGVPRGIDDDAERPQVGAQPAGRDPGLVHGFDVFAHPHAGIVADQPGGRAGHGRPQHLERGRREVELRRRHEIGGIERSGAEGAHDLRDRLGFARAGGLEAVGDVRDELVRRLLGELDLQLAEARRETRAVEHRDLVVDQLGDLRAVGVAQHDPVAHGVESGDERDRLSASERAHEVERAVGRIAGIATEVDLGPDERDVGRDRELHRPAFVVAEAEAGAGTRQPEVGGVEVRRLQPDGVGCVGAERVVAAERGHAERRTGRELELPLER